MARVLQSTLNEYVNLEAVSAYAMKLARMADTIEGYYWDTGEMASEAHQAVELLREARDRVTSAVLLAHDAEVLDREVHYARVYER